MAEWLELRERADALFDEAERLEQEAVDAVIAAADVVCSTNSTAGSDLLAGTQFDAPERQRRGSHSRENPTEAELVRQSTADLLEAGVSPTDVAVIAPYDDQVDRLDRAIDEEGLEVDTVDGVQGREKEVVLLSLVRSNDRGEIGFLDEPRRFNVAVTRARRKAVVVGDAGTVTRGDVFDAFVRYAETDGCVVRL